MLQNTNNVRIRSVLIYAVKESLPKGLVGPSNEAFVDSHFNKLVHIGV